MLRRGFLKGLFALIFSPVIKTEPLSASAYINNEWQPVAFKDFIPNLPIGTIHTFPEFAAAADREFGGFRIVHKVWTGVDWISLEEWMDTELYQRLVDG